MSDKELIEAITGKILVFKNGFKVKFVAFDDADKQWLFFKSVSDSYNLYYFRPMLEHYLLNSLFTVEEAPLVELGACKHTWQKYTGLTDIYNYCTRCDEKEK